MTKRLTAILILVLTGGLLALPQQAAADQAGCDLGTYNIGTDECEISGANTTTGTKNFHHSVRMLAGSSINASNGGITLNINGASGLDFTMDQGATMLEANDDFPPPNSNASAITINATGDMLMNAGTRILAENNTAGGNGGDITIDVDGDMTMAGASGLTPGAIISTRKTGGAGDTGVAGNITITVGDASAATGTFFMGGGATTYGAETGAKLLATGTGPAGDISVNAGRTYTTEPGAVVEAGDGNGTAIQQGGKIFLVATCDLTSRGRVTSKGTDPGADLVHLEACDVLITGLVESTGKAHATGIKNSCDNVNDGLPGEVFRDHPAHSTGCIEVWASNITIDSTGLNAGELNTDIGNGGSGGTSWIDIFAFTDISIVDGTGNDFVRNNGGGSYFNTFAVHANSIGGSDNTPGTVTAKAKTGTLTASGDVFAATTTANGSDGGAIVVEASGDVTLDNARLRAAGDFAGGTIGNGGTIAVRSFSEDVSWQNGEADVRPPDGSISITACGTITTTGTNFNGEVPTQTTGICSPTMPSLPSHVGTFFDSASRWDLCEQATKSGMKFNDLDGDGVKDGNESGLDGWTIHLYGTDNQSNPVHMTTVTSGGGNYSFTVAPGTYTVCEALQPGWQQTYPTNLTPGSTSCTAAGDPQADNPTPGPRGWAVTLAGGQVDDNNDFGNQERPDCEKQPVKDVLNTNTGRFPGNDGPDVIARLDLGDSVQNAVDTVTDVNGDDYLIILVLKDGTGQLGGHTNQEVVIDDAYNLPFGLIGCSVTLHDPTPNDANPTIRIASSAGSPGNIFMMDVHAADSKLAGVVVDGNGRYLRNENGLNNAVGFKFVGNGNTMHNGSATSNSGVGVSVQGDNNVLTDVDSFSNGGHGFQVAGNGNQLLKLDSGDRGKGNLGDGVNLTGNNNLLSEIGAFANAGDGIEVGGNTNRLLKNVAGDSSKGNGGDGIRVAGFGATIQENRASTNRGDGFDVSGGTSGSPNKLKNNVSNTGSSKNSSLENTLAEYRLLNYVRNDGGGNKADSIVVPKTTSPVKCNAGATLFPATNVAVNIASASNCE